jgi:hypothetical protein
MKPTKVAAIIAGSVMALGAATPAMAMGPELPSSLDGGLDAISSEGLETDALDSAKEAPAVTAVGDTAGKLHETGKKAPLLGGLPLGG